MEQSRMNDSSWRALLVAARRVLGRGDSVAWASDSWCAWTTFPTLRDGVVAYWTSGLPEETELLEAWVADGGTWGQPFRYADLAHLVIPAKFYWEQSDEKNGFRCGHKPQDIAGLSQILAAADIPHRLTDLVLEVKLY
jgi:hypothetical protein